MSENPSSGGLESMHGATAVSAAVLADPQTVSPRDRLLDAATQLFCLHGINATGVDAIVAKAGTAKTTLYKIFGSKHQLIEAFLDREGERWRRWFFASVDALPGSASERLVGVFDVLQVWFADDDFSGCPFINAVGEHDKSDPRLRALALQHKSAVDAYLMQIAQAADLPDPAALINELGILMDGAIVAAMISRRPEVAMAAKRTFAVVLRVHQREAA
ncbi:MAG: TetR/AcrR family transcriptional regulator [Hyphomonadaceae bacterium]|nr:TetR/AcrR family transcriptional regulator [Hyphomonadaceae bacterium]